MACFVGSFEKRKPRRKSGGHQNTKIKKQRGTPNTGATPRGAHHAPRWTLGESAFKSSRDYNVRPREAKTRGLAGVGEGKNEKSPVRTTVPHAKRTANTMKSPITMRSRRPPSFKTIGQGVRAHGGDDTPLLATVVLPPAPTAEGGRSSMAAALHLVIYSTLLK